MYEGQRVTSEGWVLPSGTDTLIMRFKSQIGDHNIRALYLYGTYSPFYFLPSLLSKATYCPSNCLNNWMKFVTYRGQHWGKCSTGQKTAGWPLLYEIIGHASLYQGPHHVHQGTFFMFFNTSHNMKR